MLNVDPNSLLILISAPSGGGKTTLCQKLLESHPNIRRAITCTTRSPRPGEVAGKDYYFLTTEEFQKKISAGEFIEHANVFGNLYGILKSEIVDKLAEGKDVLLNVDVQGAATIRQQAGQVPSLKQALVTVFLSPAKLSILEERLKRRGQDSMETIQKRLSVARKELAEWRYFDYLIISTSIEEDHRFMSSIIEAEKMRQHRIGCPEFETL